MDYSLLWLNRKPAGTLPPWAGRLAGEVCTPQGRAALRELEQALAPHRDTGPALRLREEAGEGEGYRCVREGENLILTGTGRGLLYGTFSLLRRLTLGDEAFPDAERPAYPIRMLDHWDNADGSIERGYAGNSFFFREGKLVCGPRTRDYARLLASVGLNGCCLNNVNVRGESLHLLTGKYNRELREIGETLGEYGVSLWLSVSFAALAEEYSEDAGSNTNGGLYENVARGQMVEEFENFCFSEHKPGDTGIVYGESGSYAGYHVMYYVGEGQLYSSYLAETELKNQAMTSWTEELNAACPVTEGFGFRFVGK